MSEIYTDKTSGTGWIMVKLRDLEFEMRHDIATVESESLDERDPILEMDIMNMIDALKVSHQHVCSVLHKMGWGVK